MAACELCGMFFDGPEQLGIHRARFCQGSALHKAMLATREQSAGAIATNLDEDPLQKMSNSLAALGDDVEGLSVGEFRARVTKEAAERKQQREVREAVLARAAARMGEQRAKTEMQQQLVEAQLDEARAAEGMDAALVVVPQAHLVRVRVKGEGEAWR